MKFIASDGYRAGGKGVIINDESRFVGELEEVATGGSATVFS